MASDTQDPFLKTALYPCGENAFQDAEQPGFQGDRAEAAVPETMPSA